MIITAFLCAYLAQPVLGATPSGSSIRGLGAEVRRNLEAIKRKEPGADEHPPTPEALATWVVDELGHLADTKEVDDPWRFEKACSSRPECAGPCSESFERLFDLAGLPGEAKSSALGKVCSEWRPLPEDMARVHVAVAAWSRGRLEALAAGLRNQLSEDDRARLDCSESRLGLAGGQAKACRRVDAVHSWRWFMTQKVESVSQDRLIALAGFCGRFEECSGSCFVDLNAMQHVDFRDVLTIAWQAKCGDPTLRSVKDVGELDRWINGKVATFLEASLKELDPVRRRALECASGRWNIRPPPGDCH